MVWPFKIVVSYCTSGILKVPKLKMKSNPSQEFIQLKRHQNIKLRGTLYHVSTHNFIDMILCCFSSYTFLRYLNVIKE